SSVTRTCLGPGGRLRIVTGVVPQPMPSTVTRPPAGSVVTINSPSEPDWRLEPSFDSLDSVAARSTCDGDDVPASTNGDGTAAWALGTCPEVPAEALTGTGAAGAGPSGSESAGWSGS